VTEDSIVDIDQDIMKVFYATEDKTLYIPSNLNETGEDGYKEISKYECLEVYEEIDDYYLVQTDEYVGYVTKDNLKELHNYSIQLENTLNQLSADMNDGRIKWGELTKKGTPVFATQVSNISKDSFSNLEENFHEYAGLIYDGAFSEHLTGRDKKGLTGENITEEQAKQKAIEIIGKDKIKEIVKNYKFGNLKHWLAINPGGILDLFS